MADNSYSTPQYIPPEIFVMRKRSASNRRGFTLVETVVTVGIVAALAAVVYPTVVKQFDSADPTRVAEDLNNLRTAVETFGVNVRPNQPRDIEDLANRLRTVDPDSSARGSNYTSTDSSNWRGPYISLSLPATLTGLDTAITTGFGAPILNRLQPFDADVANDTVTIANIAAADFIAARLLNLSGSAFNAINLLIDGPTEASAATRRANGRFRCPAGGTDTQVCASAFYLLDPIR
jgi:prepilin-type N-terminal cleavage/methylation domain-containing protein